MSEFVLNSKDIQMKIERILSFFMMGIGEYHADIQRNCPSIPLLLCNNEYYITKNGNPLAQNIAHVNLETV